MPTAVLLIAHGSRRPEANADLVQLAEQLRQLGEYDIVEPGYLELAEPSITAAAQKCVERGATTVLLLPYFLSFGSHVAVDLERHRSELAVNYPGVRFVLCPPLGLHALMLEIVRARLKEAIQDSGKN